jgi:pimeloyl-ACP methyl ester carboxylesterase
MREQACAKYLGTHLVEDAGHWVQQEQPEAVVRLLREFFAANR